MKTSRALAFATLLSIGCVPPATSITSRPLPPERQAELAAAVRGSWQSTHIKRPGGEKETQDSFVVMFEPDAARDGSARAFGTLRTTVVGISLESSYLFEGRNVRTESMFGTFGVDAVTPTTLELFVYDTSTVYYFVRR